MNNIKMARLLQIAFITILVTFVFSGCASKVPPKNFALHNQTVQDIKQKMEDILLFPTQM